MQVLCCTAPPSLRDEKESTGGLRPGVRYVVIYLIPRSKYSVAFRLSNTMLVIGGTRLSEQVCHLFEI